ncbi:Uncharacterised protein [Clostridium paraputrificum]|uniref:Uncharacterized protein n=1 Tax=Clostridium paraputrificum TaxID=29363 RepID=A0A6N3FFL6_9CLOT
MFYNYIYLNMDRIKQYASKVGMKEVISAQSTEKQKKKLELLQK